MKEVTTYLNFDGHCGEAMTFYAQCLGAELGLTSFSESTSDYPEGAKDRIVHASLTKGPRPVLMASDIMPGMLFQPGDNFSVCVDCESLEEIQRLFAGLGEGGKVTMPLQDMFWGDHFGMVKDRFGIHWMFNFKYPK